MHKRMIRDYATYSEVPFGLVERIETPEGETLAEGLFDQYTACSIVEDEINRREAI